VRRFAAGLRVILQGAVPDLDRVESTEGERLAWLAGECAGDSALLQEVSSLLDARAQMAGSAAAPSIPLPSASFGTYRAITLENVECLAHGLREILTRCLGRKCVIEQVDRCLCRNRFVGLGGVDSFTPGACLRMPGGAMRGVANRRSIRSLVSVSCKRRCCQNA
jgi:hypothetical protein